MLGICLGMQLLFTKSYEFGEHDGLNLIPGTVRPISEIIPEGLNYSRPKPNDGNGYHEVKVTVRFWIVGVILAVATLALLKIR